MREKIMMGFTRETSAIWPKFFCAVFRHCAVVMDGALIQIGTNGVRLFRAGPREIGKLEAAGWVFVKCARGNEAGCGLIFNCSFLTCVGFAKRVLGIADPFVWTPDQLYERCVRQK
jgi:hypothetical protein